MVGHDNLGRRKRDAPESQGKKIRLTKRDLIWFEKLHQHGPLPSSILHDFTSQTHKSKQRALNRLTDLFNECDEDGRNYLIRPAQQFHRMDARNKELVYDLGEAGTSALEEAGRISPREQRTSGAWWHQYLVSISTAQIELATLQRDDLNYIPQSRMLERADVPLRFPTRHGDLIPDALFGLEYIMDGKPFYRFHAVEVDRATEPISSKKQSRKSLKKMFEQYNEWIGDGRYKEQLILTAPLLLLFITSTKERMIAAMKVAKEFEGLPVFFGVRGVDEHCPEPFGFVDSCGNELGI